METQMRVYRLEPGALDAFEQEWRRYVVPLRQKFRFDVLGAWASVQDDTFVWIIAHPDDFASADRAYYESPERAALDPDPARHISEPRAFLVRSVRLS